MPQYIYEIGSKQIIASIPTYDEIIAHAPVVPWPPVQTKAARGGQRNPGHTGYSNLPRTNPWTKPLPTEKPAEIKNVAEELKKQKPNKDYLELFEE